MPAQIDRKLMLDVGERDARSLAIELQAELVLIDEKAARIVATRQG